MTRFLFLVLMCGLVASCASDKGPQRLCPQVASVRELDRMEDYGRELAAENTLVAVATMKHIDGECSYGSDGVDVTFDLIMEAQKGPRLGGEQASFPFFVSLVSPQGTVISKEVMTQDFVFEEGKTMSEVREPLRVFIPLAEKEDAWAYRVLLGFQLTPEQLKAQREKQ